MATFTLSSSAARAQAQLKLGFRSVPEIPSIPALKFSPTFSPSSARFRCNGSRRLKINQRLLIVSATNPSSNGVKSPNEGSDVKETSSAAQGPPLLTILAGFFVFLLLGWIIVSIIMWLINLVVNVPPPK